MACCRPKTDFPPEIPLFQVLPRLPVESLFRCMCVSKQWYSFIKSPEFVKMHLRHVTDGGGHHSHHKLLLLSPSLTPRNFSTSDFDALEDGLSVSRPLPFNAGNFMRIIVSFHGLVCLGIYKKRGPYYYDIVIWNPLTGDHKRLSKVGSNREIYSDYGGSFWLYYTSCDDDYKLLRLTLSYDAYVYSLKSDLWRKLEQTCTKDVKSEICWLWNDYVTPKTIALNDRLYVLKQVETLHSIIRFDIKTETFKEINTPSTMMIDCVTSGWNTIMVLKGCIYLFVKYGLFMQLWRMDGDDERWTIVGSFHHDRPCLCYDDPEPFQTLVRDGNRFVNSIATSSLCEQDRKMLLGKLMCSFLSSNFLEHITSSSIINFTGTLVSPNRYINHLHQDLLL